MIISNPIEFVISGNEKELEQVSLLVHLGSYNCYEDCNMSIYAPCGRSVIQIRKYMQYVKTEQMVIN